MQKERPPGPLQLQCWKGVLLLAVRLNVLLRRVLCVFGSMDVVAVRQVRMVSGCLVITGFVMLGGFVVVARSVLVVLRCLLVMIGCYL